MLFLRNIRSGVFVLNLIRSFLYFVTAILTILERKVLIKELNESPFLNINETLNEELYKNILLLGKNPDDQGLVNEYRRLTLQSNKNRSEKIDDSGASSCNNKSSINNADTFKSGSMQIGKC